MPSSTGAPLNLNKPVDGDNARTAISTYIAAALQTINDAWLALAGTDGYHGANNLACRAVRSTNQSIAHDTQTAVQFNAADTFDHGSMHDPSSNNTRITVPVAGVYRATFQVVFAEAGDVFTIGGQIRANGTTTYGSDYRNDDANPATASCEFELAAGGYIELVAYQYQSAGSAAKNLEEATLTLSRVR